MSLLAAMAMSCQSGYSYGRFSIINKGYTALFGFLDLLISSVGKFGLEDDFKRSLDISYENKATCM